ncbi:MAG TPA: serine/threonine-protein kinase [Kofleriaceae bacterium]|nr:serine/threonine-protein kinase [Kofleriaceae bacterium]
MVDDETRGTRIDPGAPTADGSASAVGVAPTAVPTSADETIVPSWGASELAALPEPGYQIGELIGRGGMGEVVAAQDQRIGREVAVKRIRSLEPSHDAVTRFLREARIQARLDHPAIVPVYELGVDADGRPYFTMKRLAGVTLHKRLTQGVPVQPLLRAFVDVCLAIQLAHSKGVVHRDLKPSNIMLGDYGEVYVLDWGVARVLTDTKRTTGPALAVDPDDDTTAGSILGTPGYMAPEQVKGIEAGTKADVYALGAILFEILAGEPLHPRGEAALSSTLTSPQEAPARRVAERRQIPPELDGVCYDALAEEPAARPSARELADRVQAYLDGDRDVERRRAMATQQLVAARAALDTNDRATAIRRAGRALALDPESADAASLVTSLLLEPPDRDHMPPDLIEQLAIDDKVFNSSRSRQGAWTYLSLFIFWLIIPFMGVKSWTALIAFYGLLGMGAAIAWRNSLRGYSSMPVTLVMTTLVALMFTRISGPFILTPVVICASLMQLVATRQIAERLWIIVVWVVVAVLMPIILEWFHVIDSTYQVKNGVIISTSRIFDMRTGLDEATLVSANFLFILAAAVVGVFISRRRMTAQRQLQIQAWHLRQLLPTAKRWQTQPRGKRMLVE